MSLCVWDSSDCQHSVLSWPCFVLLFTELVLQFFSVQEVVVSHSHSFSCWYQCRSICKPRTSKPIACVKSSTQGNSRIFFVHARHRTQVYRPVVVPCFSDLHSLKELWASTRTPCIRFELGLKLVVCDTVGALYAWVGNAPRLSQCVLKRDLISSDWTSCPELFQMCMWNVTLKLYLYVSFWSTCPDLSSPSIDVLIQCID